MALSELTQRTCVAVPVEAGRNAYAYNNYFRNTAVSLPLQFFIFCGISSE